MDPATEVRSLPPQPPYGVTNLKGVKKLKGVENLIFEPKRGRRAVGEEHDEARAELTFEPKRGPLLELSGGQRPLRGDG